MKPEIQKLKNMRGRITGYRASIGHMTADGKTPAEASEACEKAVLEALARLDRGGWSMTLWGHTYVVTPTLDGWSYKLDTFQCGYEIRLSGDFERACDSAIAHLGQIVWTAETDDRAFLETKGVSYEAKRSLKDWIAFQRAYIAAPADEQDKHRWACEHKADYIAA